MCSTTGQLVKVQGIARGRSKLIKYNCRNYVLIHFLAVQKTIRVKSIFFFKNRRTKTHRKP